MSTTLNADLNGLPTMQQGDGPLGGVKAVREPLVTGGKTYQDVSDDVVSEESVKEAYDMIGWELEYSLHRHDVWTLLDAFGDSA